MSRSESKSLPPGDDFIILASQSERRREILSFFSFPFRQMSPLYDEDAVPYGGNPKEYVCELSRGKSASLVELFPKSLILGADTIVLCENKLYGKPKDHEEAFYFLENLAGRQHFVMTAVTVHCNGKYWTEVETSVVEFHSLTSDQIRSYLKGVEYRDKAGAYAIQGKGGLIVKRIEGCFYNVMGLPLSSTQRVLKEGGIDLWKGL